MLLMTNDMATKYKHVVAYQNQLIYFVAKKLYSAFRWFIHCLFGRFGQTVPSEKGTMGFFLTQI